ncbi:MAG: hypothetical protein KIS92_20505 [Planctomycetota bacterium]|nr:hypothetical protein [Planctomycetota bacterium]
MPKKNTTIQSGLTVEVTPPAIPLVKYYLQKPGKPAFDELSGKVASLLIEPVEGDAEGSHWLRRFDKHGKLVWSTRHPSLQETFWYAEWEYGLKESAWKKG